jgi:hypothetical protein
MLDSWDVVGSLIDKYVQVFWWKRSHQTIQQYMLDDQKLLNNLFYTVSKTIL